ncbi:MAG: HAD family hydrolase [Thermoplasmatota archaeon]
MRPIVCWDLDGTILDPNGSIRASIDHAVESRGHEPFDADDQGLIGKDLRTILRMKEPEGDDEAIQAMVDAFRRHYTEEAWHAVRFYPGVRETIEALHQEGRQQAIVTTKGEEEAKELLANLDFAHPFGAIVGDDDVRPIKPDPAPVYAACGRLGQQPDVAVMIGDTIYDVAAGKAAGAAAIGVTWGHSGAERLLAAGADKVAEDAQQLRRLLVLPR